MKRIATGEGWNIYGVKSACRLKGGRPRERERRVLWVKISKSEKSTPQGPSRVRRREEREKLTHSLAGGCGQDKLRNNISRCKVALERLKNTHRRLLFVKKLLSFCKIKFQCIYSDFSIMMATMLCVFFWGTFSSKCVYRWDLLRRCCGVAKSSKCYGRGGVRASEERKWGCANSRIMTKG